MMLLRNLRIPFDPFSKELLIQNDRIGAILPSRSLKNIAENIVLDFEDTIAFPGLINSHEHLDFDLFPAMANRVYDNYCSWGNDIHLHNKDAINNILSIPQSLRVQWGMYKNLLNGFTTVVNHGDKLNIPDEFIQVYQHGTSLHSVGFEKNWKWKLNNPFQTNMPFVIHTGEGTDHVSEKEIDLLLRWNLLKRPLVGIHGVAMAAAQAKGFKALVWCPASNFFLFRKTARIDELKKNTEILFGSDSALTAGWDIFDQIRLARAQKMLTDEELFKSLTLTASSVWQIPGAGELKENNQADLVIAENKTRAAWMDAFYATTPENILLVMSKGKVCVFDETLYGKIENVLPQNDFFSRITINGRGKFVTGVLSSLMNTIRQYHTTADLRPISNQ